MGFTAILPQTSHNPKFLTWFRPGAAPKGGGGWTPMIWLFFLSAQRSFMYVDVNYTLTPSCKFGHNFFQEGKIVSECPPPPCWAAFPGLAQHRGILPPLTKHPGAAPGSNFTLIFQYVIIYITNIIYPVDIKFWIFTSNKAQFGGASSKTGLNFELTRHFHIL